jgi:hypothetical protein
MGKIWKKRKDMANWMHNPPGKRLVKLNYIDIQEMQVLEEKAEEGC